MADALEPTNDETVLPLQELGVNEDENEVEAHASSVSLAACAMEPY
ncbi:hypothetical protein [Kitasatospora camelliae]|uniref:Uncharacterized protein n=1 Tax=Kitasatospora camelliae TaxID=3156397 RepID=A0AAU8JR64_9ACTN